MGEVIIATVPELDRLPAGTIVYDREHETYLKRDDGRWAYPARNPKLSSLAPNAVMSYGPLQTLEVLPAVVEPIGEAHGISDLNDLPVGSVVLGNTLARKREDGRWDVAGKGKTWNTVYLVTHEEFPMKVLHR